MHNHRTANGRSASNFLNFQSIGNSRTKCGIGYRFHPWSPILIDRLRGQPPIESRVVLLYGWFGRELVLDDPSVVSFVNDIRLRLNQSSFFGTLVGRVYRNVCRDNGCSRPDWAVLRRIRHFTSIERDCNTDSDDDRQHGQENDFELHQNRFMKQTSMLIQPTSLLSNSDPIFLGLLMLKREPVTRILRYPVASRHQS